MPSFSAIHERAASPSPGPPPPSRRVRTRRCRQEREEKFFSHGWLPSGVRSGGRIGSGMLWRSGCCKARANKRESENREQKKAPRAVARSASESLRLIYRVGE